MGQTAHMGGMRNAYKIVNWNLKGRGHSGDLSIDGRIILKCIENKKSI
jgi:hypothetical protein